MQIGVSISTNEKDLHILTGRDLYGADHFSDQQDDPRELAVASVKYIFTDLTDIKKSYIRLGFHLLEMENCGYYKDFLFDSMEDMVQANFGMDKSAYSRCINVYREFCKKSNDNINLNCIDDRYKDYSYSQLVEMLPMSQAQRNRVKPDMSVKEIRELKNKPDVSDEYLAKFMKKYLEKTKQGRDAVVQAIIEDSKNYLFCSDDYKMRPGKVSFGRSDHFVSVENLVKYYEERFGHLEEKEIATSQPEKKTYTSFQDDEFIADLLLAVKLKVFDAGLSIYSSDLKGKRFTFEDDSGNLYNVQFSVTKKKEG